MSIKKTLLAAALAAFAFTALPALASAEVTGAHVKFGAGDKTGFTIDQDEGIEPVLFTEELEVECESFHGEGEFENTTTGMIEIVSVQVVDPPEDLTSPYGGTSDGAVTPWWAASAASTR